jgi:hypothetical protein
MNCCVCASREGASAPAVALCRHCDAGLCFAYLRETTTTQRTGSLQLNCVHDTW